MGKHQTGKKKLPMMGYMFRCNEWQEDSSSSGSTEAAYKEQIEDKTVSQKAIYVIVGMWIIINQYYWQ